MARAFVAVGSNIEPEENVEKGLTKLAAQVHVRGLSTFYRTAPLGRPEQDPFLNGVVEIETDLSPRELKTVLREIETECGRVRTHDKYAARTLDLDVIVYDELTVCEEGLILPDPEIPARPFLAVPLAELAPQLVLAGDGHSMSELAEGHARHQMEPLTAYTKRLRETVSDGS
ncbi:MAG: 2-amino-4-hydroxy-6-hydroxymethyldihydropteridine diphosphokinase [Armatimonadetes bacterium]|nr:2-amino-4-hydroxy-6-hydroxymethyldihydropteridine diphosphokinase [Armatimonadota bacterium]